MISPEYYRNRRKIHRQKAIEYFGGKCAICHSTQNLEFDHRIARINGGFKKYSISTILHYKWETILEELQYCQLLCDSCHKNKSRDDIGDKYKKHGVSCYLKRGCRCKLCCAAHENHLIYRRKLRKNISSDK